MAVPKETRWPIEHHTKVKHLILGLYLKAWLPIMATHNGCIMFIDGFAGPGRYEGGEEGSPLIALRTLLEHSYFQRPQPNREVGFLFIEAKADRVAGLQEELNKLAEERHIPKWVRIDVKEGEFADLMTRLLDQLEETGARLAPTFAFIDPFGFAGIPMDLISRIARNPKCECLITFMYQSINRFRTAPQAAMQARLDELFGTDEWRNLFARVDPATRLAQLAVLYRRQLVHKAGFKYVRTFQMIDQGNQTEYFLYFATNNLTGLSKMKYAMWKADPLGGQIFSDRTVSDQMVLIEPTADLTPLRDSLGQEFRGSGWVTIEKVQEFVLTDTPFSETIHLKRLTLQPMEQAEPPLIEVRRPQGAMDRAGDYPVGTVIRFP